MVQIKVDNVRNRSRCVTRGRNGLNNEDWLGYDRLHPCGYVLIDAHNISMFNDYL